MCQFLETIQIKNGKIINSAGHNNRINRTREHFFQNNSPINIIDHIVLPESHLENRLKCRILYAKDINRIEFIPYQLKPIQSLKIVQDDEIEYDFKYENRAQLSSLYEQKSNCDDILIVRQGRLTDTYYCNIALMSGNRWYTPEAPLLKGTRRTTLLESNSISERDILLSDLEQYEEIMLFNAMIDFGEIKLPIGSILI